MSINKGKGSGKESRRGGICNECFSKLLTDMDFELDLNIIFEKKPTREQVIPSRASNITSTPINTCPHDNTSYDPPNIKCNKCNEEWQA